MLAPVTSSPPVWLEELPLIWLTAFLTWGATCRTVPTSLTAAVAEEMTPVGSLSEIASIAILEKRFPCSSSSLWRSGNDRSFQFTIGNKASDEQEKAKHTRNAKTCYKTRGPQVTISQQRREINDHEKTHLRPTFSPLVLSLVAIEATM